MFVASSRHTDAGIAMRMAPKVVLENQLAREARIRAEARAEALAEAAEQARLDRIERHAKWEAMKRDAILAAMAVQATNTRNEEPAPVPRRTYQEIEAVACRVFNVTASELKSDRRNRHAVFARQFVMYWAARLTRLSLPQIGRKLGGRDHTTVLHGKRAYVDKRLHMKRHLRAAR